MNIHHWMRVCIANHHGKYCIIALNVNMAVWSAPPSNTLIISWQALCTCNWDRMEDWVVGNQLIMNGPRYSSRGHQHQMWAVWHKTNWAAGQCYLIRCLQGCVEPVPPAVSPLWSGRSIRRNFSPLMISSSCVSATGKSSKTCDYLVNNWNLTKDELNIPNLYGFGWDEWPETRTIAYGTTYCGKKVKSPDGQLIVRQNSLCYICHVEP